LKNGEKDGKGYLLSPKDMALIEELGTLDKIGVTSLKIEGRLKRAEYVSAVVGIYRKYLDALNDKKTQAIVSKSDMQELLDAFSRTGFTDGYFKNNLGKRMMSHDTPGNSSENKFSDEAKKRAAEDANYRKIPIGIMGTLNENSPLELTFYDNDGNYASVTGTLNSEPALHKPLDEKRLKEQLLKLGATPFDCTDAFVTVDTGITLPIKEINAVRREAADKLAEMRTARNLGREIDYVPPRAAQKKCDEIILTAEISTEEQLKAAIKHGIKIIYAPVDVLGTLKSKGTLNKYLNDGSVKIIAKASEIFREEEIETDGVLISSAAAAYKYKSKKLYGDFRLNIFNSYTAQHFSDFEKITLSPELNIHEIKELCENTCADTEVIAYGHLPLMIMKNCPLKAMGKCQNGKNIYKLRDRKREEFPVVCSKDCNARILNSKPIFMADKLSDLTKLKINSIRLIFTVENFSQCDKIIDVYKRALGGEEITFAPAENTYTRGHFYRGVL
jgi:putative protease